MQTTHRWANRRFSGTALLIGALALTAAESEKQPEPARKVEGRQRGEQRQTYTIQGTPGQGGQGVQVWSGPGGGGQVQVMTAPASGGGWGGGGWGGGGGGWNVGLDEQQRQLVREAITPLAADLQKLEEQIRAAQKEMMKAVLAENYNEKVVEEKAENIARLQTKMYLMRSKAYNQAAPTLKQEQREYMENWGFMMLQNDWALGIMPRGNVRGGAGAGAGAGGVQVDQVRTPGAPGVVPTPPPPAVAPGTPPR